MVLREPLGLKAELPRMNAGAPTIIWDKSEARKVPFHVPVADPLPIGGGFCSGKRQCPVVYSKLSKLLHQEDALGAPFSGCDFCSPQAPPGAQECCGQA
jgi:hypothetical protein